MSEQFRRSYRTDSTIYQQFYFCFKLCFYTPTFRCKTFYLQWKMKFESALMKLINTMLRVLILNPFLHGIFGDPALCFLELLDLGILRIFHFYMQNGGIYRVGAQPRIWNNFFKNWNRVQVMPNAEYTLFYSKRRRHELKVYCIFFGMHTYA